jgi:hypothetical protein
MNHVPHVWQVRIEKMQMGHPESGIVKENKAFSMHLSSATYPCCTQDQFPKSSDPKSHL